MSGNAFDWRTFSKPEPAPPKGFCKCGCGTPTGKTWARGHATRALSGAEQSRRREIRTAREAAGISVPRRVPKPAVKKAAAVERAAKPIPDTLPTRLLRMLESGPMEREQFYAAATRLYAQAGRSQTPHSILAELNNAGVLRNEVRLTDKGLKRIGAKP